MWSNSIKIAFFPKNYEKSPKGLGLSPQTPIASDGWGLRPQTPSVIRLNYSTLLYSTHVPQFRHYGILTIGLSLSLNEFLVTCQHQATAFGLPFYDTFAPTKNFYFEVSDDVVACDFWFAPSPPNQKSWLRLSNEHYVQFLPYSLYAGTYYHLQVPHSAFSK